MFSFHRIKIRRRTHFILLLAGLVLSLAVGIAIGIHVTVRNIARLGLLKPNDLKASVPWAFSLGWRMVWAPTSMYLTPDYLQKLDESNSLLSFDAGVIGPLSGIRKYNWQAQQDISQAQNALRKAFIARLGRKLDYVDNPAVRIHSTQNLKDGVQRVVFSAPAEPGYQIKGCMMVPPGEKKLPAVIVAYGAGGNLLKTCGWGVEDYHNDMGLKLAQKGYFTIVYILRGMNHDAWDWGKPEWEPLEYSNLVGYALLRGSCAMNIWVNDGLQVLRTLELHPRVDANKIMFAGVSHGGQIAMYAGAIETQRIKGVLSMGSFASFEDLYTSMHHWTGHAIPDLGSIGDMGDIAALIAPRPLLIQWGEYDGVSHAGHQAILQPSSLTEFDRVKEVYERLNAEHNIQKVITPKTGHHFDVNAALHFLDQHNSRPN
jgi:hypothetical protein